jgi:Mg2+ and Co2+ transporter CorA
MSLVTDFLSTQIKALDVVAAVLSPESRTMPNATEAAAFEQLELQVLTRANWHLTKQLEDLERIDKTLTDMDAEVRQRAEIMADQNSRAMMIFTVVTVFFLPPGFVAAYLSMGDGPDGLDFEGIQRRFWTIAGPLTATVWAICIFLAFEGTENSPLVRGQAALGKWRAEREQRRDNRGTAMDEDHASIGELSV